MKRLFPYCDSQRISQWLYVEKIKTKKQLRPKNIRKNDRTSPNLFPVVQRDTAFVCRQSQVRSQWMLSTLHLLTCIADMHVHITTAENTRGLLFVFFCVVMSRGQHGILLLKSLPPVTPVSLSYLVWSIVVIKAGLYSQYHQPSSLIGVCNANYTPVYSHRRLYP